MISLIFHALYILIFVAFGFVLASGLYYQTSSWELKGMEWFGLTIGFGILGTYLGGELVGYLPEN